MRVKTIRVAQNLQQRGYKQGDIVGIMSGNVHHLAPVVFASICMGCPISTVDTRKESGSISRMFETTEPNVVFCEVKVYDMMVKCLAELGNDAKIFTFNGSKGNSEPVENLFVETGIESEFR